jgi:two-component system response regulator
VLSSVKVRINGREGLMSATESQPETTAVEILLVEDNPSDVQLTLHALKRHGLTNRVHVVRDGAEALEFLFATGAYAERAGSDCPKVVMLDLKLPRVDGIEVLREIRANPLTHTLPVVVLTSSREERDIAQTYDLGANSYIVKPVDFEQFSEAVRQLGMYWVLLNQRPPPQEHEPAASVAAGVG